MPLRSNHSSSEPQDLQIVSQECHANCRTLYCADGRFALGHLHNYQHAASYPAFIVSGKARTPLCSPLAAYTCIHNPVCWCLHHRIHQASLRYHLGSYWRLCRTD